MVKTRRKQEFFATLLRCKNEREKELPLVNSRLLSKIEAVGAKFRRGSRMVRQIEEREAFFEVLMKDWRGISVVRDRAPTPAGCQSSSKWGLTNSGEVNSNGDDVK